MSFLSRLSGVIVVAALCAGCSSTLKEYNPKMGLLDILARMEPANHWSGDYGSPGMYQPGTKHSVAAFPIPPRGQEHPITEPARAVAVASRYSDVSLEWPLRHVEITSPFGRRGREFHEGVDLRAAPGTPVYAAHAGQVLYAGRRISGYGKMIVLRHSSGLATIYAHNSRILVHRGEWVRQGERIAYTGQSGDARGPHLHFEVREGVNAINPVSLLPRPQSRRLASR